MTTAPMPASQPGRVCPTHYRYPASILAREPELEASTLFVVGGLYGNPHALERVLELAHAEPGGATIVFNGDFHWFDTHPATFCKLNDAVLSHAATRGNVETEVAADDGDAGCGCAYPEDVSDADVLRSNAILVQLRDTARRFPASRAALASLPMHKVAQVAGIRIAIVHGDLTSLAGWSYSERALSEATALTRLREDFDASRTRVIASSHTCLPVAIELGSGSRTCALFNNGAAGMPNFAGTRYGVITRVSETPCANSLYGTRIGAAHVDAVAVEYDQAAWMNDFLQTWPPGTAAYESYYARILDGPAYDRARAWRRTS